MADALMQAVAVLCVMWFLLYCMEDTKRTPPPYR